MWYIQINGLEGLLIVLIKLHSVKKVIGVSDYSLQQFKGIDHKKLVVYNCVRPLSFRHYSMLDVHSRIQCSVNADISRPRTSIYCANPF